MANQAVTFRLSLLLIGMLLFNECNAFSALVGKQPSETGISPTSSSSSLPPSSKESWLASPLAKDFDYKTTPILPWTKSGYETWKWNDHDINYIEMGDPTKPALLLIHGFGASAYHFRQNIPVLARDYHVYAFDMLGFGFSSKPVQEYPAEVWRDQAVDFIEQVIQKPVTVAGNSLGGFTALYAAASNPELVEGCILLNSAGSFRPLEPAMGNSAITPEKQQQPKWIQNLQTAFQRLVISASFVYTKQPLRIEQVLKQVYPIAPHMVNADLVEAIQMPSFHPNAAEVFYQIISKAAQPQTFVDDLIPSLQCPTLLCWGMHDPWIRPEAADRIQDLVLKHNNKSSNNNNNNINIKSNADATRRKVTIVREAIHAGHCPHDEAPEQVNDAIHRFMTEHVVAPKMALFGTANMKAQ